MKKSSYLLMTSGLLLCFISCKKKFKEEYYPDGSIKFKVEIADGERNGMGYGYYPDGKIQSKRQWRNDLANGEMVTYYSNGNIQTKSEWENGVQQGLSIKYTLEGQLYSAGEYVNDKPINIRIYFKNGTLNEFQEYNETAKLSYLAKYDTLGNKEYSLALPIYKSDNDSIPLGKIYQDTIYFAYKLKGELKIYTGKMNANNLLIDSIPLKEIKAQVFVYTLTPEHVGDCTIPFVFKYKSDANDTLGLDGFITKHRLYVLETGKGI